MTPKTKRRIKRGIIGSLLAVTLLAGVTVYLLKRPPLAWRVAQEVLDQSSPEMREQISTRVRDRLANLIQDETDITKRIDTYGKYYDVVDPTQISETPLDQFAELNLNNAELIAMVNEFFVEWTKQRGYIVPGGVNDPVVIARDGKLFLTFMVHTTYWQQVFSGEIEMDFLDKGMAIGRVKNLYAGSLPISLISIRDMLRLEMPEREADRLGDWLGKLDHFEFRPVLELKHRRRARVLAMDVGDDDVTLKLRVQDHITYRGHNELLNHNRIAVTDILTDPIHPSLRAVETGFADVPTTTD